MTFSSSEYGCNLYDSNLGYNFVLSGTNLSGSRVWGRSGIVVVEVSEFGVRSRKLEPKSKNPPPRSIVEITTGHPRVSGYVQSHLINYDTTNFR
jgi:hypothetical protein